MLPSHHEDGESIHQDGLLLYRDAPEGEGTYGPQRTWSIGAAGD